MHAKVWPRTAIYELCLGVCNARKKDSQDRKPYGVSADYRVYCSVLGVSIGRGCLVGIPALASVAVSTAPQRRHISMGELQP